MNNAKSKLFNKEAVIQEIKNIIDDKYKYCMYLESNLFCDSDLLIIRKCEVDVRVLKGQYNQYESVHSATLHKLIAVKVLPAHEEFHPGEESKELEKLNNMGISYILCSQPTSIIKYLEMEV